MALPPARTSTAVTIGLCAIRKIGPVDAVIYVLVQLTGAVLAVLVREGPGAGLNPERAFGPALISGEFGGAGTFLLAYVVGPIVGAVDAVMTYSAIVLQDRPSLRPVDKLGSPEA